MCGFYARSRRRSPLVGFEVMTASTGLEGLRSVFDHRPAAVVLDLGLPDIDGFELVKMIRAVSEVPILAATARDEEAGIIRTLDAGADDYVVKPFSADHLEARLRAVFRRTDRSEAPILVVGDLRIDTSARVARLGDDALDLTRKEFDLLAFLASQPGHVVLEARDPRRRLGPAARRCRQDSRRAPLVAAAEAWRVGGGATLRARATRALG